MYKCKYKYAGRCDAKVFKGWHVLIMHTVNCLNTPLRNKV